MKTRLQPVTRTAVGPGGVPSDGPDDPFGTNINIAIPDSIYRRAEQLRWLIEETVRAWEADNFPRVEALLHWAIRREVGLAYLLERQAKQVELTAIGDVAAPKAKWRQKVVICDEQPGPVA
jgi:hypothetical protein